MGKSTNAADDLPTKSVILHGDWSGFANEFPRHRVLGPHNHPKLPDTVIQHSYEQLSIYWLFTTYEHCDFPYVTVGMSFRPWAAAQELGGRDSLGDFVDPAMAGF